MSRRQPKATCIVAPLQDRPPPIFPRQEPLDRQSDSVGKADGRFPTEFPANFAGVDRVTSVMPRTIFYERNLFGIALVFWTRCGAIERGTDFADYINISPFGIAADIIGLPRHTAFEDGAQSARVILYEQPVPHIAAVTVDGELLSSESSDDHERDQLLRKMKGTIIVRAVGHQDGQAVRMPPGPRQVIRCGFRCGIGRTRVVWCRFIELSFVAERPEHFVGRDVVKSKR